MAVVGMLPAAAHASGCAGTPLSGPDAGKYAIATRADLDAINTDIASLGCSYKLTSDIDLSGAPWVPIGGNAAPGPFTGTFDGDGHSLSGITQPDSTMRVVGLFGRTLDAVIRSVSVSGSLDGARTVGGLVAEAEGTLIEDAHSSVTTFSNTREVGGLVAELTANSVIRRSSATGNISGLTMVGGLVSYMEGSRIEYSFASGNVVGWGVGGLVSFICSGDISNSYASGDVTSFWDGTPRRGAGGLVYWLYDAEITHSYATGKVSGLDFVGGLLGRVSSGNRSPREDTITHSLSSLWNPTDADFESSDGGTESTQPAKKDIATYNDKGWTIVQGWLPFAPNSTKWGICAEVNNGYPFLLWEYSVNPCAVPEPDPTEVKNPGAGEGTTPTPGLSGEFLNNPIFRPADGELPNTAMNAAPIVIVALLMLGAGAAIVTVSKRRLAR